MGGKEGKEIMERMIFFEFWSSTLVIVVVTVVVVSDSFWCSVLGVLIVTCLH